MEKTYLFLILLLGFLVLTTAIPLVRGPITNIESLQIVNTAIQLVHGHSSIFSESQLQLNLLIWPYYALNGFLSVVQVLYVLKCLLVLISGILAYSYAKELIGDRQKALFAILLLTISPLAIYSLGLGIWTGDVISPIFLIGAVLALIYAHNTKETKSLIWLLISLSSLSIAFFVWNGGIYALISYIMVLISLIILGKTKSLKLTLAIMFFLIIIAYLIYIPSKYNIGVFSGGNNYKSDMISSFAQLISGTSTTLYGNGASSNPDFIPWLSGNPTYIFYMVICGVLSTGLIAFAVFERIKYEKLLNLRHKQAFIAIFCIYLVGFPIALSYTRFDSLIVIASAILATGSLIKTPFSVRIIYLRNWPSIRQLLYIVAIVIFLIVIIMDILQIGTAQYATILSPAYMQAALWMNTNTPANSTFLANPEDQTPIQVYGNRSSYLNQWNEYGWLGHNNSNQTSINTFYAFLFEPSCNLSYFNEHHPTYLILNSWLVYPGYIENRNATGTNLWYLIESNKSVECNSINLNLVYNKNGTKIYKVTP